MDAQADTPCRTSTRRTFLKGSAMTVVGTGAISAGSGLGAAQSDDFDGWFENVENYDGVVDATGQDTVTVEVGTDANGGAFGFTPAAVRVSPGTTITWEWTGKGGVHNVKAHDDSFESEMANEAGHTFEQTFDADGVSKYLCVPHESLGMKGAVVVRESDDAAGAATGGDGALGGSKIGNVVTGLLAGVVLTVLMLLPVSELRKRQANQQS